MTPNDLVVLRASIRFRGRQFPCSIGRAGRTTNKREGDGATPVGIHSFVGMLYRPDRMARPTDWAIPIGPGDLWSDDPTDQDYNLMVRTPYEGRHEKLWRADPLYDLVLLTNWNWPYATRGKGSAIFVHRWRKPGHPTEGCVALAPEHLLWIAQRLSYQTRLIVQP